MSLGRSLWEQRLVRPKSACRCLPPVSSLRGRASWPSPPLGCSSWFALLRTCVPSCHVWGRVCTPRLPPCCIRRIDRGHRSTTVHYPFHRTSLVLCPLALPPAPNYLAFCGALATLSEGRRFPSHAMHKQQLVLPRVCQITDIPYVCHLIVPHPTLRS